MLHLFRAPEMNTYLLVPNGEAEGEQWKQPKTKVKKLVSLGVPKD
jgi:hypothetical protein